jgi:acetyl/propionyl-CoA carboxylase alpha subunit
MPGVVIRVLASEGDRVEPRQPLVVLEAMKMETPLVSPYERSYGECTLQRASESTAVHS